MSLYLSRLILNPRSWQVIRELDNPYEMHRTLMRAFPSREDGGPGRVLFRADIQRDGTPVVLVQSDKEPCWSPLLDTDYLLDTDDNPACKEYDPKLRQGQRLRFLLRANPTVKKSFDKDKPSKRIGLYDENHQRDWFERKANEGGFTPNALAIIQRGMQTSRRAGQVNTHLCVEFVGVLTITDPDRFLETIRSGIGSAKAYGFGLLSIAPAR